MGVCVPAREVEGGSADSRVKFEHVNNVVKVGVGVIE